MVSKLALVATGSQELPGGINACTMAAASVSETSKASEDPTGTAATLADAGAAVSAAGPAISGRESEDEGRVVANILPLGFASVTGAVGDAVGALPASCTGNFVCVGHASCPSKLVPYVGPAVCAVSGTSSATADVIMKRKC